MRRWIIPSVKHLENAFSPTFPPSRDLEMDAWFWREKQGSKEGREGQKGAPGLRVEEVFGQRSVSLSPPFLLRSPSLSPQVSRLVDSGVEERKGKEKKKEEE